LDDAKTWPHLIMDDMSQAGRKRPWVGSVGSSGLDTTHHLSFVQHSYLAHGVDVIVFLVGVNDFERQLHRGAGVELENELEKDLQLSPAWRISGIIKVARYLLGPRMERERFQEDARGNRYRIRQGARQMAVPSDELHDLSGDIERYKERIR